MGEKASSIMSGNADDDSDDGFDYENATVEGANGEETAFEGARATQAEVKAAEESNAAGDTVVVTFVFDDGMEAEDQFTQGQEVGHMKMKVAEAKGVGYNNVVLRMDAADGTPMMDPLSLADYPTIKATNTATVHVEITE